ncbi:MAG: type II secretion system F family protein [Candidatus Omnitrophica bacterium]|nr:type II secretion system F family protein [Candidatus Omnitrophota bacterium]
MIIKFTRQFFILMKAGIPLLRTLKVIHSQLPKGRFKNDIEKVILGVQEGRSLSESLAEASRFFSLFYINMIKAAEVSGNLVAISKELSDFLTRQRKITKSVQAALMYPILVLVVAMAILAVLFTFIIPVFVRIFEDLGGSLPPSTLFLIGLSKFAVNWGWTILLAGAILTFLFFLLSRKDFGKYFINQITWRIPLFGRVTKTVHIARFCRVLGYSDNLVPDSRITGYLDTWISVNSPHLPHTLPPQLKFPR